MEAARGFASPDAMVFMPVGKHHALMGTWPEVGLEPHWVAMPTDARVVATLNGCLVRGARRFVASATESFSWMRVDGSLATRSDFVETVLAARP
jgi:hypothetical protein